MALSTYIYKDIMVIAKSEIGIVLMEIKHNISIYICEVISLAFLEIDKSLYL